MHIKPSCDATHYYDFMRIILNAVEKLCLNCTINCQKNTVFFYIVVFVTLLIKNNGQILEIINNV